LNKPEPKETVFTRNRLYCRAYA